MTYDLTDIRRKLEMGADIGHETLKKAFMQATDLSPKPAETDRAKANEKLRQLVVRHGLCGRIWCERCQSWDHECGCDPNVAEQAMHDLEAAIVALLAEAEEQTANLKGGIEALEQVRCELRAEIELLHARLVAAEQQRQRDVQQARREERERCAAYVRRGTYPPLDGGSAFIASYRMVEHIADCMLRALEEPKS